jgi:hypothetical protein
MLVTLGLPTLAVVPHPDPVAVAPARTAGGLVVVAGAVALVSGVALAFVYRPGEFGWLRTMHSGAAAAAVITAIAARVVSRGGRVKVSSKGALLAVALVMVLGGAFATGSALAWRGGVAGDRGMFLGSGGRVEVGHDLVSRGSILTSFAIHTVIGACSFVLLGGEYVRAWCRPRLLDPRRRRRPPASSSENSGSAGTT